MSASYFLEVSTPRRPSTMQKVFPPIIPRLKEGYTQDSSRESNNYDKPATAIIPTENSPACRFFPHDDGRHTGRTTTRSTKLNFPRQKASSVHSTSASENGLLWDLSERVDSFNMRVGFKQNCVKTMDNVAGQIELCSICYQDIQQSLKIYYPDLNTIMSTFFESVFKLMTEISEISKATETSCKKKCEVLESSLREIKAENAKLSEKYLKVMEIKRQENLGIEKEVEKLFPSDLEDIKMLKDNILKLKDFKYEETTAILKEIYTDLSKQRNIPDVVDIDFSDMNTENVVKGIKGNYEIIITSTIKSVKNALRKSNLKINAAVQTTGIYIEPKKFEELNKTYEKAVLMHQSTMMQFDRIKEEYKTATYNLERAEIDKSNLKNEIITQRKENDYKAKEIFAAKADLESKKTELISLQRMFKEKVKENEYYEKKLTTLEIEKTDLKKSLVEYEREKIDIKSIDIKVRRAAELNSENGKTIAVPGSPKPVLSKEELEKMYGSMLNRPKSRSRNPEVNEPKISLSVGKRNSLLKNDVRVPDLVEEKKLKPELNDTSSDTDSKKESFRDFSAQPEPYIESVVQEPKIKLKKKTKKTKIKSHSIEKPKASDSKHSETKPALQAYDKKPKKPKANKQPMIEITIEKADHSEHAKNLNEKQLPKPNLITTNQSELETKAIHKPIINLVDKACGKDIYAEVSIGVQTGEVNETEPVKPIYNSLVMGLNPNTLFGLRGDTFYEGSVFHAHPRIPDLPLPFTNSYISQNSNKPYI